MVPVQNITSTFISVPLTNNIFRLFLGQTIFLSRFRIVATLHMQILEVGETAENAHKKKGWSTDYKVTDSTTSGF